MSRVPSLQAQDQPVSTRGGAIYRGRQLFPNGIEGIKTEIPETDTDEPMADVPILGEEQDEVNRGWQPCISRRLRILRPGSPHFPTPSATHLLQQHLCPRFPAHEELHPPPPGRSGRPRPTRICNTRYRDLHDCSSTTRNALGHRRTLVGGPDSCASESGAVGR